MASDGHVQRGGRRLRLGISTGTCAALAAGAATELLLRGATPPVRRLRTPGGFVVQADIHDARNVGDRAVCAVKKDAGDDPDVTDGVMVYAVVAKRDEPGIVIDGGVGVGRVTRPGLDQPVGAAAINRVPRRMITEEVTVACRDAGYAGGVDVVVSIPDGEKLAARTFNPRLGVEGGLSVIGTKGIVEPMSTQAVIDTLEVELRQLRAEGVRYVVATPGGYGRDFVAAFPALAGRRAVTCANHIGLLLDFASGMGFSGVLLVGHAGKLVKLAGGIMDTHSRVADCRLELVALQAVLAGADPALLEEILAATTVEAGLDLAKNAGLADRVVDGLLKAIGKHLAWRAGPSLAVGAIVFGNDRRLIGATEGVDDLLRRLEER